MSLIRIGPQLTFVNVTAMDALALPTIWSPKSKEPGLTAHLLAPCAGVLIVNNSANNRTPPIPFVLL